MQFESLEVWREEFWKVRDCARDFETGELSHAYARYEGRSLDGFLKEAIFKHGFGRVRNVLAYTVRLHTWDGRYSQSVKDWAVNVEQFPQPPIEEGNNPPREYREFSINEHPVILNDAAKMVMKMEKELIGREKPICPKEEMVR